MECLYSRQVFSALRPRRCCCKTSQHWRRRGFFFCLGLSRTHQKQLALLIHQSAANFPDHKWKFFVDHQKFLKSHRDKSSIEHIALLSAAEVHKPAFATVRALTGQSFFGLISQLEPERSFFGRASQRGR